MSFTHLHIHSDYSIHDSILKVKDIVGTKEHKAIALTDDNNLFGAIKFYNGCRSNNMKPIIGSEINIKTPFGNDKMVFISKNTNGYKNLMKMISLGYENRVTKDDQPYITWQDLANLSTDLFVLSGGNGSLLFDLTVNKDNRAIDYVKLNTSQFGSNYFIELQRLGLENETDYIESVVNIASTHSIPVVATNNVRFKNKEDFETHEIREAISSKNKLLFMRQTTNNYSPEQYLKSPEQMAELFKDIPSAISNTNFIAKSCNLEIQLGKEFLPDFPVEDKHSPSSYLVEKSNVGLQERMVKLYPDPSIRQSKMQEYQSRLDFELDVINGMGFPGYFLIVMEFIQWSKQNDIPVGPGRGSGAGSLVAYALKITDIDPLEFDLLFERFLNPERVSMPDFDIDFCTNGRDRVIKHVSDLYGHTAVSQIATFGTMAAKMVVNDVSRALNHPYMFGSQLSKLIPERPGIKLQEAINEVPALRMRMEDDPQVSEVIKHALKLEGTVRQVGKHAGGVLISPTTITDFTPIYKESENSPPVSQFDKNDVEAAGLVKFDFLGLKTMTVIDGAMKLVRKNQLKNMPNLSLEDIDINIPEIYDLIREGNTTGIFQLESAGMKSLIHRLEPKNFEEIIALVALFRPGPLDSGMVDTYINCKKGIEKVRYPDPSLEPILDVTYGVFVYQEQVMKAAQVMAGFSLGQADLLRKAMGKKSPEEMTRQRDKFIEGSVANGLDAKHAGDVFNLIETFAGYGFNKSHSAGYALVSIYTGYFKAIHPTEFFTSLLTNDIGNETKLVSTISDAKDNGQVILSPCINQSNVEFSIVDNKDIIFSIAGIKGVGESVQEKIMTDRRVNGPYKTMFDLMLRVRPTKTVVASLLYSGAFDSLGIPRQDLHRVYDNSLDLLSKFKAKLKSGIKKEDFNEEALISEYNEIWNNSFNNSFDGNLGPIITPAELIIEERKRLGFYLSAHPMDSYKELADAVGATSISSFNELDGQTILDNKKLGGKGNMHTLIGAITDIKTQSNKKGLSAQLTIDDGTGQTKVRLQNKLYNNIYHLLERDSVICLKLTLTYNPQSDRKYTNVYDGEDISMLRQKITNEVVINIDLNNEVKKSKLKNYLTGMKKGAFRLLVNNTSKPDEAPIPIRNGRLIDDNSIECLKSICDSDNAVNFKYNTEKGEQVALGLNLNDIDEDLLDDERSKLDRAFKAAAATMGMSI